MLILPAIDLRGGQCVRLRQGDYAQETVFGADPAAMAQRWVEQGATYLHLVDLDGAKAGRPSNGPSVQAIIQAAGVPCQLGGGLRTREHIVEVLSWGVQRVVIGTKAVTDPDWLTAICQEFPGQIVLGIDARNGQVAVEGWLEVSAIGAIALAQRLSSLPLAALVYTDISKDGMLQGPNFDALSEMAHAVPLPVIASGGVTSLTDVARLKQLGLSGAIVGRALYEGRLDLHQVLATANTG